MSITSAQSVADIPAPIARRAVEWLVELQAGDATQDGLHAWLAQHPDHARAWQRIESVNDHLREVTSPATKTLAHATLTAPRSKKRREAIKTLAALFFVGSTIYVGKDQLPQWTADERTAIGERRTLMLEDGTKLVLNTDSAVNVRFNAHERRVLLVRGEIMIVTAKDTQGIQGQKGVPRAFIVQTTHGELQPLGTRFVVREQDGHSRLEVFEGAVEIRPDNATGRKRVIHAGERAQFNLDGITDPVTLTADDEAWVDDMLIVSGMRLQDFLAELSRYRRGRLSCDPSIADLRVSGTYPLNNTDMILHALRRTLPVDVHFMTRYWVTIRPTQPG